MADAARVMLAVTMVLTYPMELFVLRHAVSATLFEGDPEGKRHYRITIAIWASTLVVAIGMEDLGAVLEVTGALAASYLSFIIPARMHFARRPCGESWEHFKSSRSADSPNYTPRLLDRLSFLWSAVVVDGFMLGFGYAALVLGSVTALVRFFWGD